MDALAASGYILIIEFHLSYFLGLNGIMDPVETGGLSFFLKLII